MAMRLLQETVIDNDYIPSILHGFPFPSVPQGYFLTLPVLESLYGGAAGGGKSAALLAGALQYVEVPGYSAILFRRTLTDLEMPGALIPMSHDWLSGTDANWNGSQHQWTFPSGATVSFGYLKDENDHFRYKSAAFQYIGFDELTSFRETPYRFLFGRIRKPENMNVPLRCRSASNPGDIGHDWVKERFFHPEPGADRIFVPAKLEENPGIDREKYLEALQELDPVTRAQMRHGNWDIRPEGNLFKRSWFGDILEAAPANLKRVVRAWDCAATEASHGKDPDYTVGAKVGRGQDDRYYILDILRTRSTPQEVEKLIAQTAQLDGKGVSIRIEQEPGSSGKSYVSHIARDVLNGYDCRGVPATGDKVTRANPFSATCERGDVKLVRGNWISAFLDELCAFPQVNHDDQVDAVVGAYAGAVSGFTMHISDDVAVGSA